MNRGGRGICRSVKANVLSMSDPGVPKNVSTAWAWPVTVDKRVSLGLDGMAHVGWNQEAGLMPPLEPRGSAPGSMIQSNHPKAKRNWSDNKRRGKGVISSRLGPIFKARNELH